ncbi:lipopolysaccharide transport periplasmic protein LptA [Candidatus Nitrosacidococcus tergens]|uniref:Lipopolysaccharide export system protein LptA n=1 Tax=Candidatus Nitrosacidococcus tergens TaxID=553981 RepID=A0A7G1QBJ5_9GAMM|nr:lipopolysaccharide transport periplasmic protein LptA [Candidatus Nitrosacidococcus tergens]CAB1277259.1 Lipopolysaccharide transport periplasmic protein LptA (modular protein) [Candidatus Nitrosacidococcus tergens]
MYQQVSLSFIIFGLIILNLNWKIVLASSSTEEKPIHIDANRGELDDRKQTAIYYGDVHLTQDDMKIDSDTLTIFYDENKKIEKMIAVGKPAWFHQLPSDGSKETKAKALRMEYEADKSMIYLFKEAHVWQGDDDFTGDYIEYDTEHRIVKGQGGEKGTSTGRIHVTIYPNEESNIAQKDKLDSVANTSKKEKKVTKNSLPTNTNLENHTNNNEEYSEQIKSYGYTKTKLNLRSEASTKAKILALLPERTPITILKTNGEWFQITATISGKTLKGWVASRFINIEAKHRKLEGLNLSEPQTKIKPEKDDINTKEDVKLPENKAIVTTKNKGTLEIIPEDELKPSEIKKYEIKDPPALEGALSDGRTKTWLKLLDRPHRKGKETALIPPRTQVVIYGHQGPWAHIATLVNGKAVKGWVKESDIRLKEEDDLEESS